MSGVAAAMRAARVRRANDAPVRAAGSYVLYFMQAYRRLSHNHALDHALVLARELRKPLVVYEGLRADYPWASARISAFVIEGMRANARVAARLGLAYWPFVETPTRPARGLVRRIARHACAVVTDDYPCFVVPEHTAALAATLPIAVIAVDGCSLVPLARLGPTVGAAAHLRGRIHAAFADAWAARASARPRVGPGVASALPPPFEPAPLEGDLDALLATIAFPRAVPRVQGREGGADAGRKALRAFVDARLEGYAERRRVPAPPEQGHASGLSPYLHFGHVGIEEVADAALGRVEGWSARDTDLRAKGKREGFYTQDPDVNAFLDEAITWRDVGFHWHRDRRADTRSLDTALPAWARATLGAHAGDHRAHVYDLAALEGAATHDPLWNAAQRELVATGGMHGYLRMLWGKKVIEWSRSPDDAYAALVHLNNVYALDGRDPNSYTGILWCFGLFDRPWAPERAVLGTVRYMSSENTARKFRLGPYLDWVATLPGGGAGARPAPGETGRLFPA